VTYRNDGSQDEQQYPPDLVGLEASGIRRLRYAEQVDLVRHD